MSPILWRHPTLNDFRIKVRRVILWTASHKSKHWQIYWGIHFWLYRPFTWTADLTVLQMYMSYSYTKSILTQHKILHRLFKAKVSTLFKGILFHIITDAALGCLGAWACSLKARTYTSHCKLLCSHTIQLLNCWITAISCLHQNSYSLFYTTLEKPKV